MLAITVVNPAKLVVQPVLWIRRMYYKMHYDDARLYGYVYKLVKYNAVILLARIAALLNMILLIY
jgi:hypothetical protein